MKEVKAGDNSEEMVGHARERLRENGEGDEQLRGLKVDLHTWDAHVSPNFRFCLGEEDIDWECACDLDALALPLDDESVDYALLNFGPQLMRDAEAALKGEQPFHSPRRFQLKMDMTCLIIKMYRVLKPGGAFGYTVWIKAGWIKSISGAHLNLPRPLPAQWEDQSKNAAFLSSSAFDFKPDSIKQEYFEFDTVHQDVDGLLELMQVLVGSKLREADWETFVEFVKGESEGKEGFEMHWGALVV